MDSRKSAESVVLFHCHSCEGRNPYTKLTGSSNSNVEDDKEKEGTNLFKLSFRPRRFVDGWRNLNNYSKIAPTSTRMLRSQDGKKDSLDALDAHVQPRRIKSGGRIYFGLGSNLDYRIAITARHVTKAGNA